MVGVFVAFIRVVYGRMVYMSLPFNFLLSHFSFSGARSCTKSSRGVLDKKLYLKQSREVKIFLYFFERLALVLVVAGVRCKSLSMSIYNIVKKRPNVTQS